MSTLLKTSSYPSLRSMMEDFWNSEKLFDKAFVNQALPAVNIQENKKHYKIEVAAPGFKKSDFNVKIENGVLAISAETDKEESKTQDNYTRKEFFKTSFIRSFSLPENVAQDNITAKYEDGVLKLTLGKQEDIVRDKKEIAIS